MLANVLFFIFLLAYILAASIISTPKACLRAALGVQGMKWRVWEQKLLLAKAIMEQEEEVLARQVLVDQVSLSLSWLAKAVQEIYESVGLPNKCHVRVTKEEIKENISMNHMKCLKEELQSQRSKELNSLKTT